MGRLSIMLLGRMTSNSETEGYERREQEIPAPASQKSPVMMFLGLCVERQAAAVRMFLGFFGLGGRRHRSASAYSVTGNSSRI
jgi:hypothetical protein